MTACIMFTESNYLPNPTIPRLRWFPDSINLLTRRIIGAWWKPGESGYGNPTHVILDIRIQLGIWERFDIGVQFDLRVTIWFELDLSWKFTICSTLLIILLLIAILKELTCSCSSFVARYCLGLGLYLASSWSSIHSSLSSKVDRRDRCLLDGPMRGGFL